MDEGEGVEDAFELLHEIGESVRKGVWVGDCFIYTNDLRLNYCVGGEVTTIFHLDRPMYLLGYLAAQNRVYLIDKQFGVVSYTLLLSLIEYKTLVLRGEMEAAEELMRAIPREQHNSVAKFLESRGQVAEALRVATDPDYRFELAVQLGELGIAREIVENEDMAAGEMKWKQLGELAMAGGDIELAGACLAQSGDLSGQLLLCSAVSSPSASPRSPRRRGRRARTTWRSSRCSCSGRWTSASTCCATRGASPRRRSWRARTRRRASRASSRCGRKTSRR